MRISDWSSDVCSSDLLDDTYTLYSPGTGAAQKAALMSAYKRKQNVVFYYWYPTPLVGALDLVKLEMPPYDAEKHKCLTAPKCANPQPSAYPERSEEHTSELQSLMRNSYAVFCLKKKNKDYTTEVLN